MLSNEWYWVRKRLAQAGILPYRAVFSDSVWGAHRDDPPWADEVSEWHRWSVGWMAYPTLAALEQGRPMAFAHFNEGECRCLLRGTHRNRDRVEICTEDMREMLSASLCRLVTAPDEVRERFLLGVPCPRCHGPFAADLLKAFPGLQDIHRVPAVLFHHSIEWSRPRLGAALRGRGGPHFFVCSPEHDAKAIEAELGIRFTDVLRVDRYEAHLDPAPFGNWLEAIGWENREAGPPPTLMLCCGIMGRVWAIDAFIARPDSVTLCLGSYFDDIALGRILSYASGTPIVCDRCLHLWRPPRQRH